MKLKISFVLMSLMCVMSGAIAAPDKDLVAVIERYQEGTQQEKENAFQEDNDKYVHLFESERYDELERIGQELIASGELNFPGSSRFEYFINALKVGNYEKKFTPKHGSIYEYVLKNWAKQYPESDLRKVVEAMVHIEWAWQKRGEGFSDTVSLNSSSMYDEYGERGYALMQEVYENNKIPGGYFDDWITLASIVGGREAMREVFDKAVERDPYVKEIYSSMAYFLLPKWYGSLDRVLEFAEEAAEITQERFGDAMYYNVAQVVFTNYPIRFFTEFEFDWERVKKGFVDYANKLAPQTFHIKKFAYMLSMNGERENTLIFLDVLADVDLGGESDYWPKYFEQWYAWANNETDDFMGVTPMHYAIAEGDREKLMTILKDYVDQNKLAEIKKAFEYAIRAADVELTLFMFDSFDFPKEMAPEIVYIALNYRNQLPLAKKIIEKHLISDYADHYDENIIHEAARKNRYEFANWYLQKDNSIIDALNNKGMTPLYLAAYYGNIEMIEVLIDNGADINLAASSGYTPLMASIGNDREISSVTLIERGADIRKEVDQYNYPMRRAIQRHSLRTVKAMFDKGWTYDEKGPNGFKALHTACEEGNVAIVKWLLTFPEADVNEPSIHNSQCVHLTALGGNLEVLKFIRDQVDLNAAGAEDYRPIHNALAKGNDDVARYLIEQGADLTIRVHGYTPYDSAAYYKNQEMMNLIKSKLNQ